MIEKIRTLNAELQKDYGVRLALRIGIHTGLVVTGSMGGGAHYESQALVGQTPNIAARLQEVADPDTVVVSSATLHLTPGLFLTQDLGNRRLRGLNEPVALYRVLRTSGVRSRLDVAARLTPFVGRQQKIGLLLDRWEQVQDGTGQVVLLSGEAGIGKSRLVQCVRQRLAETPHAWLECCCSPYTQNSAFHPPDRADAADAGLQGRRLTRGLGRQARAPFAPSRPALVRQRATLQPAGVA